MRRRGGHTARTSRRERESTTAPGMWVTNSARLVSSLAVYMSGSGCVTLRQPALQERCVQASWTQLWRRATLERWGRAHMCRQGHCRCPETDCTCTLAACSSTTSLPDSLVLKLNRQTRMLLQRKPGGEEQVGAGGVQCHVELDLPCPPVVTSRGGRTSDNAVRKALVECVAEGWPA